MIIKRPLDWVIHIVPIEYLKRYYKPEEVTGYCKHCPRYGKNWSCPPHAFNVKDYCETGCSSNSEDQSMNSTHYSSFKSLSEVIWCDVDLSEGMNYR
ncbi:MAG: hypothetical protein KAQ69_01310 [Spirochaetales bacterium]|nr:hypothetical protein [Spirochaetales bacterium]